MRVDVDVMQTLSNAQCDGNMLKLVGQLDRKLYTKTNKVLEAAGGKWNRKEAAHVFSEDAADSIEQIILTGEVVIEKQEFGYFPTPLPIVQQLIGLAELEDRQIVLEPSAGTGNIAAELVKSNVTVHCYELLEKNYIKLTNQGIYHSVKNCDFLAAEPEPIYDRIVMNPPFAKQADIKHINHAMKFLKPDGKLVSVMGASVTFMTNKLTTDFNEMVRSKGGWFEELPDGAFKESGTMVNTVIVAIPN